MASRNALVAAAISLFMTFAYARRMQVGEAMLVRQLGEAYRDYMRETGRLLPKVY